MQKWFLLFCIFGLAGLQNALGQEASNPSSSGTGFFVNDQGWLLTNAHVIDGCNRIEIPGYGFTSLKLIDRDNDIAAVRVTGRSVIPLKFSNQDPRLGEDVIALGFPLITLLSNSLKVTTGNVSSLAGPYNLPQVLQHSAPIQHGNSGGPLLDQFGRVIAMNSFILDAAKTPNQNVNFAIKASSLINFLRDYTVSFEFAAGEKQEKQMPTADITEAAGNSVVQVLCYGENSRQSSSNAPTDSTRRWFGVLYENVDFWGGDKYPKGLEATDGKECAIQCISDPACKAFTFNPKYNRCFVKEKLEIIVNTNGLISGVIFEDRPVGDNPPNIPKLTSDFQCQQGIEHTGINLPFWQPRRRYGSLDGCLRYCFNEKNCSYVTFDPTRSGSGSCIVRRNFAYGTRSNSSATACEKYSVILEHTDAIDLGNR